MRRRWFVLAIIVAVLSWALVERRVVFFETLAATGTGAPPPLLEKEIESPVARWHDDYFTIEEIAPQTFAIGEPRYAQQNYNYLIIGDDRALLFDAGPGIRDIRQVAEFPVPLSAFRVCARPTPGHQTRVHVPTRVSLRGNACSNRSRHKRA